MTATLSSIAAAAHHLSSLVSSIVSLPLLCASSLSIVLLWYFFRTPKVYPPGPPGKLILGNLSEMAPGQWYKTFTRWQGTHGTVQIRHSAGFPSDHYYTGALVYASLPGKPIYIVNSYPLAEELIGKGTTHAGRPQSVFKWSL
jgi:hypothetical protein